MIELFTKTLNISISATFLIVVCLVIRLLFKKMPKYLVCILWAIVAIRLIVPFSIESPFSLLPAKDYIGAKTDATINVESVESGLDSTGNAETIESATGNIGSGEAIESATGNIGSGEAIESGTGSVGSGLAEGTGSGNIDSEGSIVNAENGIHLISRSFMAIVSVVWLVGAFALLIYALASYIRLRLCLRDAVRIGDKIYESDKISTAFVLGIIRPVIYVPCGLSNTELYMVLSHERSHIERCDHLLKPLFYLVTSVYWFNPAVWIAYILLCRDIEYACDERAIKKIGYDKRKSYSQTLLDLSVTARYIKACPVAFGEINTGERVKRVLNMKKRGKIVVVAAAVLCLLVAICFLTYPKKDVEEDKASEANAEYEIMDTEQSKDVSGNVADAEVVVEKNNEADGEVVSMTLDYNPKVEEAKIAEEETESGAKDEEAKRSDEEAEVEEAEDKGQAETEEAEDKGQAEDNSVDVMYVKVSFESADEVYNYLQSGTTDLNVKYDASSSGTGQENVIIEDGDENIVIETMEGAENLDIDVQYVIENHTPFPLKDDSGKRYFVVRGPSEDHNGVDIAAPEDTEVIAMESGEIIDVGVDESLGQYVILKGKSGLTYGYYTLKEGVSVNKGDTVSIGDKLGLVGMTGNSTGPHLHLVVLDKEN
ncbi:MAG: peptidoglycan DD-metalloendopeptidase family protein [Eubacterium sp.]|nr:peptidoglycan DD-metalloendopeptidase family protein [Eubacterium sp.]